MALALLFFLISFISLYLDVYQCTSQSRAPHMCEGWQNLDTDALEGYVLYSLMSEEN